MNNYFKHFTLVIILISCFIFLFTSALAEDIAPYADVVFKSATVSISSSGSVTFRCSTKDIAQVIEVTSCTTYKKNSNGTWSSVSGIISAPTTKSYNSIGYTQTVSPQKSYPAGTYRITATFSADGHTKTATSAERTFN